VCRLELFVEVCFYLYSFIVRRVWRYQRSNRNP